MIDLTVERLIQLLKRADLDTDVCQVLEEWRSEYTTSVTEAQQLAEQASRENPMKFGIRRVERAVKADGGKFFEVDKDVEHLSVTIDLLPHFARYIGVSLSDLQDLLDGKIPELRGKGKQTWKSWESPRWSASKLYVDYSAMLTDRQELEEEDTRMASRIDKHNELVKLAVKPTADQPQFTEWSN